MHYKSFPIQESGTGVTRWREIILTPKEEFVEEQKARRDYLNLMKICIDDARKLMEEKDLPEYQADILGIALNLFRKRSSHVVYWKNTRCREKFEFLNKGGYKTLKKKAATKKTTVKEAKKK